MSNINIKIIGGTDATNATLISWLEANGTLTPQNITLDLSTIGLPEGTHNIQISLSDDEVTKADSELSNTVVYEQASLMPSKGDLITFDLGSSIIPAAGTNNQYRVLSVDGNVANVVAMFDANTSIKFDDGGTNTYAGKTLDTYLNTTWYNSLSNVGKGAIVTKNITQYQYSYSSSVYNANTHASYADYSTKSAKATSLSRNVYALDVEDIENYFNHTFSTADIWELFWNVRSKPSTVTYLWLRSAIADLSSPVWYVRGSYGSVDDNNALSSLAARPAFAIDLSKITWSKV